MRPPFSDEDNGQASIRVYSETNTADEPGQSPSSTGVLYIAFGEKYKVEARRSIRSLRAVSPDVSVAVVTDAGWHEEDLPDVFVIRHPIDGFASKPYYIGESPFERTLYIDTDTYIARDLRPVFGLLEYYDVGVRFAGPQLNEPDGLAFHAQCNSGVVLFRNGTNTARMFSRWIQEFEAAKRHLAAGESQDDPRGLGDQRYLAIAIAKERDVRPVHLGEYLNFALFETLVTYSPPAVFHGRLPAMDTIAEDVNGGWNQRTDWHVRLWLPNLRGVLPAGLRRSDPLLGAALVIRRLVTDLRRSIGRWAK